MPVSKPVNNIVGASLHGSSRADAARRTMSRNAALGLDNFSSLLHQEISGAPVPSAPGCSVSGRSAAGPAVFARPAPLPVPRVTPGAQPIAPPARTGAPPRPAGGEGAALALRSARHRIKSVAEAVLGSLSALFESGREGVAAIGYDRMGGTSYGKYQIASKTGTLDEFIAFLEKKAPRIAGLLKEAGPADTGGRDGRMPETWKEIAAREPGDFEALQHAFVFEKLYVPAAQKLKEYGLDEGKFSPAMREVLFSAAVQHGPAGAARILARAARDETSPFGSIGPAGQGRPPGRPERPEALEERLIKRVYRLRQSQFGSSSEAVQKAVSGRLHSEMNLALRLLRAPGGPEDSAG